MPATLTYPGVYVDEVPTGGARAIIAVPTSITAFVGMTPRGELNVPVTITSFAAYERTFGALDTSFPLSVAVFQFFLNGGGTAIVVRAASGGTAAKLKLDDKITLQARSPGTWGQRAAGSHDLSPGRIDHALQPYGPRHGDWRGGAVHEHLDRGRRRCEAGPGRRVATGRRRFGGGVHRASEEERRPKPGQDPWDDAHSTKADGTGTEPGAAMPGTEGDRTGIYALLSTDIFNLLCVFPAAPAADATRAQAAELCVDRRAFLILDAPWETVTAATGGIEAVRTALGSNAKSAAMYFPNITIADPTSGAPLEVVPSGAIAGVYARTDAARGVWKAPAGTETSINGALSLTTDLSDPDQGQLNPLGLNCLRRFPGVGIVSWGARTLRGSDRVVDDPSWKYVPIRRTALFIEESLYRGTQFVVFEPNDEPLWAAVRLTVGAFMNTLFRQGAFQGTTPTDAYLVKCDAENNPQEDIDRGILNILVGFAPLKPAEFVLVHIQQLAGQTQG